MKVAFIDYVLDPAQPGRTGLSDLVWAIAPRLAQHGDDVHVIGPYAEDAVGLVANQGVRIHRFALPPIGYRNIAGHLLIVLRACAALSRLKGVDLVHTPEYTSAAIVTITHPHLPLVFTEPGNIFERVANGNPYDSLTTQVYKLAARRTATHCARCIATSDLMMRWWARTGVPVDRISVIPIGVDTTQFRLIHAAKVRLDVDPARPMILYAARLSRENGVDVSLRAVASLREMVRGLQFHVLGDGVERDRVHALGDRLGLRDCTFWHGWVPYEKLPLYYSAADLFLFSGFSGGTPRVLLQAMACNAPVVASAIGGIVDHVTDGENGLLFAPGEAADAARQMSRILENSDLSQRLSAAGRSYVERELSWESVIGRIREAYRMATSLATRSAMA